MSILLPDKVMAFQTPELLSLVDSRILNILKVVIFLFH